MVLGLIIVTCLVMIAVINLYMKIGEKREDDNNKTIEKILTDYKNRKENTEK